MKNMFIHKIKYRFHRIGFYLRAVKFYIQDNKQNENIIKCIFKAIFSNLRLFNYKLGYYEYLEIPITTKCSLKCKHCSNLIPCYKNPHDYDLNMLIKSINAFLECINKIVYIRVLGGEPFISKNLYDVLKTLLDSNKIYRIEIVTNGTIIPNDKKLIKLLKDKRIIVSISQYPIVDYNKLVDFLKDNNIGYRIDKMNFWMDYGKPIKHHKTKKELTRQYTICSHVCKSLVNGEFHLCPRSSHGRELGIIKDNEDDYLNLLDKSLSIDEKRKRLNALLRKKYIIACDYCDFATNKSKKVPVAEQLKGKKKNI